MLVWIVAFHLVMAAVTWRDISGRTDDQIRGNRTVWRVASLANSLGWVAYWVFGRRAVAAV